MVIPTWKPFKENKNARKTHTQKVTHDCECIFGIMVLLLQPWLYTSHPLHGLSASHAKILKLAIRWHPWHDHFQVQDFQVTNLVGPKMTIEGEKCGNFPNLKVLNKLNNPHLTPKKTRLPKTNVQQKFDQLEEKSCCVIMWNHFAN